MFEVQPIDTYYDAAGKPRRLSFARIVKAARRRQMFVRVDGWSMLWPLGFDPYDDQLRAQCPTSPVVRPVVEVKC